MEFLTNTFELVHVPPESFRCRRGLMYRLEADVRARAIWYTGKDSRRAILRSMLYEGFASTLVVRIAEALSRFCVFRPLGKVLSEILRAFTHLTIGRGAEFGPGLVLLHPFGLHIHKSVSAGHNLSQ